MYGLEQIKELNSAPSVAPEATGKPFKMFVGPVEESVNDIDFLRCALEVAVSALDLIAEGYAPSVNVARGCLMSIRHAAGEVSFQQALRELERVEEDTERGPAAE